jgi:hypothetical protein
VARIGVPVAGGFLHLVVPLEGPSEMQETEVRTHDRGAARHLRIEVDGRDVLSSFREMPDGSRLGLLTGLSVGPHTIVARANGSGKGSPPGRTARLDVVNHPITGPLFSGPQQQPFFCETVQAGLDPPTDADFTPDQQARLQATFPGGVCDWTKPGVDAQPPLGTWLDYGT